MGLVGVQSQLIPTECRIVTGQLGLRALEITPRLCCEGYGGCVHLWRCVHWKCGVLDGDGISSIFHASVVDGVFLPQGFCFGCDVRIRMPTSAGA